MKISEENANVLIDVLNAQSGVRKIDDQEVYNTKVAQVRQFLITRNGAYTGGIKAEIYETNQNNRDLVAAAKAHKKKAKDKKIKAQKRVASTHKVNSEATQLDPDLKKEKASLIVRYLKAITSSNPKDKISDPTEFRIIANKSLTYIDHTKGGLKQKFYDEFKMYPKVKETCKAHKKWVDLKNQESKSQSQSQSQLEEPLL